MSFRGIVRRGHIYIADLEPTLGSEEGKERRVLVVSNDVGNSKTGCPVIIAVPITGQVTPKRLKMPMLVPIYPTKQNGQTISGMIDCFQIRVLDIDKRLKKYVGFASDEVMEKVDAALETCLQLKVCPKCKSVLLPRKKHCVQCKHILVTVCKCCMDVFSSDYNYCPRCGKDKREAEE